MGELSFILCKVSLMTDYVCFLCDRYDRQGDMIDSCTKSATKLYVFKIY